jgi:hypothetical protein
MTKAPSPLLGYNNNVRHKNRVFHIQTEDSGVKHPHVITHLFMDGGRILKSVKTSYAEHIGKDKLGDVVRQMMKDQHKAMFRALRDGELDAIVDEALGSRKSIAPRSIPPPTSPVESGPSTIREPGEAPLTLDLDAIEPGPAFHPQPDLPPPPENVLAKGKEVGTGRYRTLDDPREERSPSSRARPKSERPAKVKSERPPRSVKPAIREERPRAPTSTRKDPRAEPPSEPKQPAASRQSSRPQGGGVRPAAIFGQARPQQSSIFGEDIISDKSLDEVILSYLAEDLDEGK